MRSEVSAAEILAADMMIGQTSEAAGGQVDGVREANASFTAVSVHCWADLAFCIVSILNRVSRVNEIEKGVS